MIFASDNWAGAHPKIAGGLAAHASGFEPAYGNGELDKAVADKFNEIFEREVAVFFVGTGTAANSLSLTLGQQAGRRRLLPSRGACRSRTSAARRNISPAARGSAPVDGALGRIDPAKLDAAIARYPAEVVHSGRPVAVSITQSTEIGTVYGLDDIAAISRDLPQGTACRCTWTARASPTRWSRSTRRRRR